MKEASIWLNWGQQSAIDVEGLDFMAVCTPWQLMSAIVVTTINQAAGPERSQNTNKTHIAKTGACSWTLKVRRVSLVAGMVFIGSFILRSHSLISPFRLPEISSLTPPRCICTFVIHCLCSRQTLTIAVVGLWRWSNTRTAPSPNPAIKILPATWSEVKEVIQEPDRADISCKEVRKDLTARPG